MPGNRSGGLKARDKNLAKDPEWYSKIGALGGKKGGIDGVIKGFAAMTPEKREAAGRLGGTRSRRTKSERN